MWKTAFKKFEQFKDWLPQISLGPFLNTLSHFFLLSLVYRKRIIKLSWNSVKSKLFSSTSNSQMYATEKMLSHVNIGCAVILLLQQSWFDGLQVSSEDKVYALRLFGQLLFTSISTGTLCGKRSVAYSEPCETSQMEGFAKVVNGYLLSQNVPSWCLVGFWMSVSVP